MKKLLTAFCAIILLVTACKKEPSFEDPNSNPGGTGSTGTKLLRMGERAGTDSATTDFTYTGDFISRLSQDGSYNGQAADAHVRVVRNAANLITTSIVKSSFFGQLGFDSLVTNYTIDPATSRYRYSLSHYQLVGINFTDSSAFTYDGAGKLIQVRSYVNDGTGYGPDRGFDYGYSGSNLTSVKSYIDDGNGGFAVDETTTYEYDTKTNPLHFPADAPVLGMTEFYSANNATKETVVGGDPSQTTVTTKAFSYNSSSRPIKAVTTSGSDTSTLTYYYQ